jgi:hypothetical protein
MRKSIQITVFCATLMCIAGEARAQTVAYWPFGTNYVYDASTNGYHLQADGVIFQDGAALLNSNSVKKFSTLSALTLSPYSAVTLEFWLKTESATTTHAVFELGSPCFTAGGLQVILNPGDGQNNQLKGSYFTAQGKAYKEYTDTANTVADGIWHHFAVVVDRNAADNTDRLKLYLDGELQSDGIMDQSGSPLFKDARLFIGSRNDGAFFPRLDGMLDDIRITAAALTPSEFIQQRTIDDHQPLAYWPFGTNEFNDVAGDNPLAASGTIFTNGAVEMPGNKVVFFDTAYDVLLSDYDAVTLECWLKTSSTAQHVIFEQTTTAYMNPGAISVLISSGAAGEIRANYYVDTQANYYDWTDSSNSAADDNWHHIAMVVDRTATNDSDRVRLYFDNQLQAVEGWSQSSNTVFRNGRLYIGSRSNATQYDKFTGLLDDIRITAAALRPGQFVQQRTTDVTEPHDDLIAYWPFGEHGVEDVSGNTNHLFNQNVVLTEEGYALFNGVDAYLKTQRTLDRSMYSDITIECWFKPESEISTSHHIFSSDNIAESGCYYVYLYQNSLWGQLRIDSAWQVDRQPQFQKHTNAWHHLAYVVSGYQLGGYQLQLFVDGQSVSLTSTTTATIEAMINQTFWIGTKGETGGTGKFFKGRIDDIRVTGRALAPWEFMKYRSSTADVLAYWPFRSGTLLMEDASGNDNTLTNINTEFEHGAAVFNGTDSYLKTVEPLDLSNHRYMTIECFAQFGDTASPDYGRRIFSMTNTTGAGSMRLYTYQDRLYSEYRATNTEWNQDYLDPLTPLGDEEWHHLACVINPLSVGVDNSLFYVDGALIESGSQFNGTGVNWLFNKVFFIGAEEDNNGTAGNFFTGRLDDIRIVDRALLPSEFMTIDQLTVTYGTLMMIR